MSSADYYRQPSSSDINLVEYGRKQEQYGNYQGVAPNLAKTSRGPIHGKNGSGFRFGKKWIAIGVIIAIIIAGAVVGGIVGSNASKTANRANTGVSGAVVGAADEGVFTTVDGTPQYPINMNSVPLYPSSASSAAGSAPTVASSSQLSCGPDNYTSSSSSLSNFKVRTDRPVLVAPSYRWDCLPSQIANDEYMNAWNATIFTNASRYADMAPQPYTTDGGLSGSGVLDPAREIQLRMKHWAYAWRMTKDTKWSERAWLELQTAAGNNSDVPWGTGATGTSWNTQHFLDLAEFTAAFAYGYDWMYDAWTPEQSNAIMWSIINLGLRWGLESYTDSDAHSSYGWWQSTNGNWNCVCNKGLTWGALAILNDDPTGIAQRVLSHTVSNSLGNCYQAVQNDGTWTETADYWYFGSTSAAELWSGLQSATGMDFTSMVVDANPDYNKTGLFHMYGTGTVQKFNYGDCGPNKYTATANCLMYFGDQLDVPTYTLYQRERVDAPEPLSMFWYNPETQGDWWDGLALDNSFTDQNDTWASMRSSWTDPGAVYAAIKSGKLLGHQTHGDLDNGDFVFEALGQRWAGELCQAQYLAQGYFSSEEQDSERWLYYRTRTEGQNTLVINYANQDVDTDPTIVSYGSNGNQGQSTLGSEPASDSTAFWVTDMSSAYSGTDSVLRGMRLLNARSQMLLQDEVTNSAGDIQWRMHTNATISYSNSNQRATLTLGGETLIVDLLSPSGASFASLEPVRYDSDPPLPSGSISQDLPNPGVTVLSTTLSGSQSATIQVLFTPLESGMSASSIQNPPSVPLSDWTLTSHQ